MLRVKDIRTMFKDAYRAQQFTTDRTGAVKPTQTLPTKPAE